MPTYDDGKFTRKIRTLKAQASMLVKISIGFQGNDGVGKKVAAIEA